MFCLKAYSIITHNVILIKKVQHKMNTFEEVIKKLKLKLSIEKDKELYQLMGIKQSTFTNWRARNKIPYEEIITYCNKNNITFSDIFNEEKEQKSIIGNNNINGNNSGIHINGNVHINNVEQQDKELCELIKQLEPKEKEYYYHLIKADLLKKNL